MTIKKIVSLFCVVIFLISCSDKNVSNDVSTPNLLTEQEAKVLFRMREPENRVSLDEVMKLADEVINILDRESSLRSVSGRSVSTMSALVLENKSALRSSDFAGIDIPDTLAHILNFNDSLGFAIISADTRVDDQILAFSGSGSLIDSTDNPGIAIFLENLEGYILNAIIEAEQQKDSLLKSIEEKLSAESNTRSMSILVPIIRSREISRETVRQITPLVSVEWGQGKPFNDNLGGVCAATWRNPDGKFPAGCVAVAVAHIISYWRLPPNINGHSFNWNELNRYTARPVAYNGAGTLSVFNAPTHVNNQLANLLQQIGRGVNMNYNCAGSGTSTSNSVAFLLTQGFRVGGVGIEAIANGRMGTLIKDYNSSTVITSLDNRRPLMIAGCSEKNSGCHQWVIDGYLRQRITRETTIEQFGRIISQAISTFYPEYIHNNWGWNGVDNGYFASGVFNSNLTPIHSGTRANEPYNYQHRLQIVPNIHR